MSQPLINISRKQALVFAAFLVLYEFLTYIANDMIMPGMVQVVDSFQGPESAIATSLTAYILGGASLQLFLGPISDRYGRRPVMIFGASFFFVCTILIACSNSIEQFLLARFFQGMGLCFIAVIGYATLQEIFAEMDAVRLIAIMANAAILAPLIGPLLGAIFVHYYNWRLIFVIIGAMALFALWGLWRFMPEPVGQTKTNGEEIKPISLAPKMVAINYKNLLFNPSVFFGSVALGLLGLPCIIWIALAPVILINEAKLSVIQYGLWQMPLFAASIAGNWFLQKLTYHGSLKKILLIGSLTSSISLLFVMILPLLMGSDFLWLMPGLLVYFFGLGVATAPLNRLILFSTSVGKGTTSAFMTLVGMCLQAGGIEVANVLYSAHNNIVFAMFCALVGIIYFFVLAVTFMFAKTEPDVAVQGEGG
ncbi:multidrug efflux system protein [Legionella lansingensis]|uniref:Multidrug transporter MdfA n=1 Tax=Legionella lansingensis TaxID=45067 RepID=A0A0W0VUH3_9GAMM|nr:MFS transporter [Legionella lansingensis]KTD23637.1 multidrug efflux system protein [Legionella lansingensis]SNV52494.1 multidrug efflux system protein [Legionella lansingensis]